MHRTITTAAVAVAIGLAAGCGGGGGSAEAPATTAHPAATAPADPVGTRQHWLDAQLKLAGLCADGSGQDADATAAVLSMIDIARQYPTTEAPSGGTYAEALGAQGDYLSSCNAELADLVTTAEAAFR